MANPVLVEVTRGERVESAHRGAVAVCDADGALVCGIGDIETPVFPRSAVKALQALPVDEAVLGEAAPLITGVWLATALKQARAGLPKLVNFVLAGSS